MPSVPEGDSVTTGQIAREVLIGLTGAGEQMLQQAPTLLQERFIDRFGVPCGSFRSVPAGNRVQVARAWDNPRIPGVHKPAER